jgi:hypothetical protein
MDKMIILRNNGMLLQLKGRKMINIFDLQRILNKRNRILKHLRFLLLLPGIIFFALRSYSQAVVTSTIIEKENRNAVMIQIDQPVDRTTDALEQRLKHSGLSGKSSKNVTTYKAVTLSEISTGTVDIYTKVEKGSTNQNSIVYMAVSKGYDNFTSATSDSMITENVKRFLNSFVKDANYFSAEIEISTKLEEVNKAESAYQNLLDDLKDLENKKTDIEGHIVDKQKEINEKKSELEHKRAELDELKTKRTDNK